MLRRFSTFALPLAAMLSLTACAGGAPAGKVLRVGLQDEFKTLDPAIGYDVPSWGAEHLIYNGLVTYDFESKVAPDLAESWQVEGDGKAFVFKLRDGLKFHDGRPVTAKDVVYSFDRLLDPATKSPGAGFYADIVGATERLSGEAKALKGVTAPDDKTVRIELKTPNPIFLQLIAMPFASVVPAGITGAELARKPVGTGPFSLASWSSGQKIAFKKNPHYFNAQGPQLDGVEYQLGVNESLEVLKFERGELDLLGANRNIPAADFSRLKDDPKLKDRMLSGADAAFHYVGMNCQVAPFDKPQVRQAVAHAIDKSRIVQLVNGRGRVANGILPPTMPGFDPNLAGIPHDPAKAKALLAQAGLPDGFAATYYCVSNDTARKVAQSIQQDLGKVGIKLELKPLAFPTFLEAKATKGRVGIASGNWTQDFPDPSNFLTTMFHSKNIKETNSLNDSYYRNPKVDTLLDQAGRQTDAAKRADFFRQAEAIIVSDAPVVPLYYPVKYQLHTERVKGYKLHPVWAMDLTGVSIQ